MDSKICRTTSTTSSRIEVSKTNSLQANLHAKSVYTFFNIFKMRSVCQRTKITPASCRKNAELGWVNILRATSFGNDIGADREILSEENESILQHRYAVVVQDLCSKWIHGCPKRNQTAPDTMEQRFLPPEVKLGVACTNNPCNFIECCDDECSNRNKSYTHRSEANRIAERAV